MPKLTDEQVEALRQSIVIEVIEGETKSLGAMVFDHIDALQAELRSTKEASTRSLHEEHSRNQTAIGMLQVVSRKLKAELAEARKDGALLDKLERYFKDQSHQRITITSTRLLAAVEPGHRAYDGEIVRDTLRAAIDDIKEAENAN